MSNEPNVNRGQSKENDNSKKQDKQEPLPLHNPLNPDDHKEITQEDIDNEQKYKEAMTERD